ncbi:hypothetical protein SBOR_8190 [Sclerotinia borealis F-4128]|uniref:Uncharacterized protein n=1 Tax=Sclerotinia borealis (strain F-4128) TaxID=1432307 RepID=W9C6E2_SCLBF|nr:hypothetical protein SBOR_8190 [Sclerotinia borealis F-4128]
MMKILLLSPRNSVAAQLDLIRAAKCAKHFVTSGQLLPSVATILAGADTELQTLETPTVEKLLTTFTKNCPYNKNSDEVCDEPLIVMLLRGQWFLCSPPFNFIIIIVIGFTTGIKRHRQNVLMIFPITPMAAKVHNARRYANTGRLYCACPRQWDIISKLRDPPVAGCNTFSTVLVWSIEEQV